MDPDQNENKLLALEKALRESESRFSAITSVTADAVVMVDETQNIIYFNRGAELIFGYPSSEVLGRPLNLLMPDRFAQSHHKQIQGFAAETTPSRFMKERNTEIWGRRKDGSEFPAEVSISKWKKDGKTVFTAILRDITERQGVEEKLRKEHAFRKPIEDSILAGIVAGDLDGRLIYVNPAFCKMVGWSEEELIGSIPPFLYWPPEETERFKRILEQRLNSTESPGRIEVRFRRKNGERIDVVTMTAPLTDGRGKKIGILSTFHDVTEFKRIEAGLAREKERLSLTLSSIADCIITTDNQGKINLMNKSAGALIGCKEAEMYGKPFSNILNLVDEKSREPFQDIVAEVLDTGKPIDLIENLILLTRSGSEKIIEFGASSIRDEKSNIIGVAVVFRDITDRQEMRQEIQKIQKLESLGILAGGIAHDFNNLLTGILGNISLARFYMKPADRAFDMLNEAEKASLRAAELSRQLLTFSKGGGPVKKIFAIKDIMEQSVQFALRGSNVQSKFSFGNGLWPVECDEGQISQVIQNLVINAHEAMASGGTIWIKARNLTIGEEHNKDLPLRKGNYVEISIQDEGIGIPKELLSKIFDPYFTAKQKGSGLGLSIAHSIMQRHGGLITVKSKTGVGTTFFLYLPTSPISPIPQKDEKEQLARGTGRVLIMDDEVSVLNVAGKMLKDLGYEVDSAPSGTKALQKFIKARDSGHPYDVVISDLTVPGDMGGIVLLEKLKKIDPQVKVIVSSGYSNDPAMADFKSYGFTDFMIKPYRFLDVSKTLHRVLTNNR